MNGITPRDENLLLQSQSGDSTENIDAERDAGFRRRLHILIPILN